MKAFSFFSGIGGSTQGYKEAGINVIGTRMDCKKKVFEEIREEYRESRK